MIDYLNEFIDGKYEDIFYDTIYNFFEITYKYSDNNEIKETKDINEIREIEIVNEEEIKKPPIILFIGLAMLLLIIIIAIIILLICVLFELNGSSIGCWQNFLNTGVEKSNVIFGKSRRVRADEWATFTPMMFSQKLDGFHYISSLIRGGNTDVFIVYGLPVLNILQIFRPFQIGFLVLGSSRGLSFYWLSRFLLLFLVSFEFGMIYTKKNKNLSFIYSM